MYMAASMVNIAEFRCRDLKARFGQATLRLLERNDEIEAAEPPTMERETDAPAENPAILNISVARENPRMRQRMVLHAVTPSRGRSNLVRFNEPRVAVMRIKQTRAIEDWVQDDYDHPPAA
jgi:hypothetical protein